MRELGDLRAFLIQGLRFLLLHAIQILPHRLSLNDALHAPRSTAGSATTLTKSASATIAWVCPKNPFLNSVMDSLLNHHQPLVGRTDQLVAASSPPKGRGPKRCRDSVAHPSSRFT